MEKQEFKKFIQNNLKEIRHQILQIIKHDINVQDLNIRFSKKGNCEIVIKMYYGNPISIGITPKNINNQNIETLVDFILENLMKQIKNRTTATKIRLILNTYHQEFYNKILDVLQQKLKIPCLIFSLDSYSLLMSIKNTDIKYNIPLNQINGILSLFENTKFYTYNDICILTEVQMKESEEITIDKITDAIIKHLVSNELSLNNSMITPSIKGRITRAYNDFNMNNCKYLNNKTLNTDSNQFKYTLSIKEDAEIHVTNDYVKFIFDKDGNNKLVKNKQLEELIDTVKNPEFQKVKKELNEIFDRYHVKITNIKGPGIYHDVTTFNCNIDKFNGNFTVYYKFNNDKEWFDKIVKTFEGKIENLLLQKKSQEENREKKIDEILSNFIVQDIITFVRLNEEYITENAVAQYMRGNSVQLNTYICNLNNRTVYKNYTAAEIKDIIKQLLKLKILRYKNHNGKYGKFQTLNVTNKPLKTVTINDFDPFTKTKFNDFEAEKIFLIYKNVEPIDIKTSILFLSFINCKGFIAKYEKEYFDFLKHGSDNFKKLVKMKLDSETNNEMKKFYRKILKK